MVKFLGIQLSPASVQSEGLTAVFDRIQATGAHAIGTGLGVVEPVDRTKGRRNPPLDIDGNERLLDRPLWGAREQWLKSYRCHQPDKALFEETPYKPGGELAPPRLDRDLPHKIIAEAHRRGLEAYVSVSPTSVPGVRVEDQVLYPHGQRPDQRKRVAIQGCPNNPSVRAFGMGVVRDTVRSYPEADGVALDWVEYTVYGLEDHFGCLCEHCAFRARSLGYDWEGVVSSTTALWDKLHALGSNDLQRAERLATRPWELMSILRRHPGLLDLVRFKADTVLSAIRDYREAITDEAGSEIKLDANGWIPPFSLSSGMDYHKVSRVCDAVRPKLHTFHWSAIPRWYGQVLQDWNAGLAEQYLLDALVAILDLRDNQRPRSFAKYGIPAPEVEHPALPIVWRTKLDEVADEVSGGGKCYAYAHSYRPESQWKQMLAVVRDSRVDGMWVQRYGYLTDSKLDAITAMWR